MGQQQLLLIILGVIIVGIAIAVGLSLFAANSIQANKDAIINDLNNLAANAYQFRIRPTSMGGGGGVYDASRGATAGYTIPFRMSSNDNATYSTSSVGADAITFVGTSTTNPSNGTVTTTLDADGKLGTWVYTDNFE
jgi:hypothetical protein